MTACSITDDELLVDPSQTTEIIMTTLETVAVQHWWILFHHLAHLRPVARSAEHGMGFVKKQIGFLSFCHVRFVLRHPSMEDDSDIANARHGGIRACL
jgi:hypothetical protein